MEAMNVVDASIQELQAALSSGAITSVELVANYLRRISVYDQRGACLNSIPIINRHVFAEAAASDDRRASGAPPRPLEGIPFTVKDSYKVKGMTVASGSPAFKDLIANEDAFTVAAIRAAGGVLIGKTNMPSMAYGGMQRGIYGRAESPYNPKYLAAAFASGSSNGSGVSTAASFAAFGLGEETVSSGRSPASNNAIVAYTPSRGWISIRGNWPLYLTCDVVVPHTRTMEDMIRVLEVISAADPESAGDFWREQPYVQLPKAWPGGTSSLPRDIESAGDLKGLRVAVPSMYVGGDAPVGAKPVHISAEVIELWQAARRDLEALGAEVIIVPDLPAVTAYENPELLPQGSARLPPNWHTTERSSLIACGWEQFLKDNGDANIPSLVGVDGRTIYPESMRTAVELSHMDPANAIHWDKLAGLAATTKTVWGVENLDAAVRALEGMRKALLDDYLAQYGCDCFVFPAAGDVGPEDAQTNNESADKAWQNGVHYSSGNRAIRHLGIPTVTVPMGLMRDKQMPVGLTFAGRSGEDVNLLKWAYVFERATRHRVPPPLTPSLDTDIVITGQRGLNLASSPASAPEIIISVSEASTEGDITSVRIAGSISTASTEIMGNPRSCDITVVVDGKDVLPEHIKLEAPVRQEGRTRTDFTALHHTKSPPPAFTSGNFAPVALEKVMVIVTARGAPGGRPSGWLGLIDPR